MGDCAADAQHHAIPAHRSLVCWDDPNYQVIVMESLDHQSYSHFDVHHMCFVCLIGDVPRWKGILFKEPSLPAMSTALGALLEAGCFRRTLLSWLGKLGAEISEATVFSWVWLSWSGCFVGMICIKSGLFDIQHIGYTGYLPNWSKQLPRWHEADFCQSNRIQGGKPIRTCSFLVTGRW